MSEKIVLIDGHSIINRAFYGVPDLTNASGLHTNAVYGFLNIMFKILEEEKPDYLTVAFDLKAPTFRHKIYKEYKGTRKPMPEELREQVPVLKEVLTAMDIKIVEQAGLEADDILGTLAKNSESKGLEVTLVSGDRDLLQIASEHIKICLPKTHGGRTEMFYYYAADVEKQYGVNPIQFIDLKALMGDTADNIPGVPKVGEKTATELIKTYGSLAGVYENIEAITKKSIKETLENNKDLADLSKVLATIEIHADIAYNMEEARIKEFFTAKSYPLFKQLELKSYLKKFDTENLAVQDGFSFAVIDDFGQADTLFEAAGAAAYCGFMPFVSVTKNETKLLGMAIYYDKGTASFIPVSGFLTEDYLTDKMKNLSVKTKVATFDVKSGYPYLDTTQKKNDTYTDNFFDVLIAAYLINPLKNDYQIEDIASEYLGVTMPTMAEKFGKKTNEQCVEEDMNAVAEYVSYEAFVCGSAMKTLKEKLCETKMLQLFEQIEMPLSLVLFEMEKNGVVVKREELKAYSNELIIQIEKLQKTIYEEAGEEFNINSPKQLGEILFEHMLLPGGKKTKTGYSTAVDVLEKLQADYPIVNHILSYRALTKLNSTYAEGLANFIADDNRIHTSYNQTITATGRISSTEPNLQNIPMRMEQGRLIRKVFVPEEGYLFTDADYSQIELRILAHMSGDEQLIEAYKMDEDIHRITASKVFHTPFEEVTDLQRRNAKAVNFGIVYGISSFGLSQDLSISPKEASAYIKQYFETYPKVKQFLDKQVEDAKKNGYITTMFGRRRPVPELASSNFMQRSFGERIAMNSPIQGTAADIMKIAMIRVWIMLREKNLKSRLILQIHDELVIETWKSEEKEVAQLLEDGMKKAASLAVELEVDLHTGTDWYEAK